MINSSSYFKTSFINGFDVNHTTNIQSTNLEKKSKEEMNYIEMPLPI